MPWSYHMHIALSSRCVVKMICCRCIVESSLHNINDDYWEVVADDVAVVVDDVAVVVDDVDVVFLLL